MRTGTPVYLDPSALSANDRAAVLAIVDHLRVDAGTGGQCGFVAEILNRKYGWEIHGGVYHSDEGLPIGDHIWNFDPDTGAIIDATADQFGAGAHVHVINAGEQAALRYRFASTDEEEAQWLDAARALREERGDYWWLPDGPDNSDARAYEDLCAGYTRGTDRNGVLLDVEEFFADTAFGEDPE